MNSDEFLKVYKEALVGKVPDRIINENVNYYKTYIDREIRNGKTETDVLQSLGNPRLLARTLVESTKFANGADDGAFYESGNDGERYRNTGRESGIHMKQLKMPGWLLGILIAIVALFIIAIVLQVAFFLAPFVIAFLVAIIIIREIRNWINRY